MTIKNLFVLFLIGLMLTLSLAAAQAQDAASDLLNRVNNLRASVGVAPYTVDSALAAAAQQHAAWIIETGVVGHSGSGGSGPRTRAVANGYPTTEVNENVYGGSMATPGDAWAFWVNSGTHYQGMVDARYQHIGVGVASNSWGTAFVLVFGNPGGPPPYVPPPANQNVNAGDGSAPPAPAAAWQPPAYVLGEDEFGNIMHEIQPNDTIGDIAFIYGYGWDDLNMLMAYNGMTENDQFGLEVGGVFLVPPHDGTYTPTPDPDAESIPVRNEGDDDDDDGDDDDDDDDDSDENETVAAEPTATPTATATPGPTDTPVPTATLSAIVTARALVAVDADMGVAALPTPLETDTAEAPTPAGMTGGRSPWLVLAVVVQVMVLGAAGVEFVRRLLRRES